MKNSEEINKYYKLINEYIDIYLDNWKISPKKLKRYLSSERISNFLEKKGLKEIKNIERIIEDVIQDRISIETDSVMTFESFESFELNEKNSDLSQCLHIGINKSNINHEKILADHFDISLSQIDSINSDLHQFKINDDKFIIYDEKEIEIIKSNIKDWMIEKILLDKISIKIGNKDLNLEISNVIDKEKLENYLSQEIKEIKSIISSILGCELIKSEKYFLGKL